MERNKPYLLVTRAVWDRIFHQVLKRYESLIGEPFITDVNGLQGKGHYFMPAPNHSDTGKEPKEPRYTLGEVFQTYLEYFEENSKELTPNQFESYHEKSKKKARHYYSDRGIYDLFYPHLFKRRAKLEEASRFQILKDRRLGGLFQFLGFSGGLEQFLTHWEKRANTEVPSGSELEKELAIISLQRQLLNLKTGKTSSDIYWLFISRERGIRVGKLGVYDNGEVEVFFHSENSEVDHYTGKMEHEGGAVTFNIKKKRQTEDSYENLFISLFTDDFNVRNNTTVSLFWGVFSGFSGRRHAICGTAALQHPKLSFPGNSAFQNVDLRNFPFPEEKQISFLVKYRISNRREVVDKWKPIAEDKSDFDRYEASRIKPCIGTYEAFYRQQNDWVKAKLIIKNDLSIEFSTPEKEFWGRVKKFRAGVLAFSMTGYEDPHAYWNVILNVPSNDFLEMEGIFIGTYNREPMVLGRIYLKAAEKVRPELLEANTQSLPEFLLGHLHENPAVVAERKPFDVIDQGFVGTYAVLYLNSNRVKYGPSGREARNIHVNYLKINENGTAVLKSRLKNNIYHGRAFTRFGVITIQLVGSREKIFLNGSYQIKNVQGLLLNGVYVASHSQEDLTPICGREVLVKLAETTSFEDLRPELIRFRSKEHDGLDKRFGTHGLKEILTGPVGNYIKVPSRKLDRKYDFGSVFFYAACYSGHNRMDERIVLNYLHLAFLHGFASQLQLQKELKEKGALYHYRDKVDIENFWLLE